MTEQKQLIKPTLRNIPDELKQRDQWVVWKAVWKPEKNKWDKVPHSATNGRRASHSDSSTWSSYKLAEAAYQSAGFDGVGYVFTDDDPYCGIDLDNCCTGDSITFAADKQIKLLDSYTEISPSGTGVKIICRATHKHTRHRDLDNGIEVYDHKRFFTTTGRVWGGHAAINDRQPQVDVFCNTYLPERQRPKAVAEPQPVDIEDIELLDLIRQSKQGELFKALYDRGDLTGHQDDHSRADQALCNILAWWAGGEAERIGRLFCGSKLYRDKWERTDYRDMTIEKAIASCEDFFTPPEDVGKINAQVAEICAGDTWSRNGRHNNDHQNTSTQQNNKDDTDTALQNRTADQPTTGLVQVTQDDWPDIKPIEDPLPDVPPFPRAALRKTCPVFHNMCESLAHHLQIPYDLPAMLGLSVLSIPLAGKVTADIRPNTPYHVMMWTITIMESGTRKTACRKALEAPIVRYEQDTAERMCKEIKLDRSKRKVLEKQRKQIESQFENVAGETELAQLTNALLEIENELDKPAVIAPRWLVSDATPEAAASVAHQQQGRFAVIDDEGTFLQNMGGRYSSQPNYNLCLAGHTGERYTVDRVERGRKTIPAVYAVLGFAAQPVVLQEMLENPFAQQTGFLPRFMISFPEDQRGERSFTRQSAPQNVLDEWDGLLRRLFALPSMNLAQEEGNYDVMAELHDKYERELAPGGRWRDHASVIDKAVTGHGQLIKLAGVLHCASGKDGSTIPGDTFEACVQIIEYVVGHVSKAYAIGDVSKANEIAHKALNIIRKSHEEKITLTYLQNRLNAMRGRANADTAAAVMGLLTTANILRPHKDGKDIYHHVNPKLNY